LRLLKIFFFLYALSLYSMEKEAKIFVAGHKGLVGSAIVRALEKEGYSQIITKTHKELDLTDSQAVDRFFASNTPDYVFLAAAKVGGIKANQDHPGDFIRINLAIELNVIEAARRYGVKKLLFLGSSCIYPKLAKQPITEYALLDGHLEKTNDAYAVAKIAGIMMCDAYNRQYGTKFISCMPTNLYGPGDNFDLNSSHVMPALIRKTVEAKNAGAKQLVVWGSGRPLREFLHVDDLANACLFLMDNYEGSSHVNVGCGEDITIRQLAEMVCDAVGFTGELVFDSSKPDGTPRKLLDISKIKAMGWSPKIHLEEGIKETVNWYLSQ